MAEIIDVLQPMALLGILIAIIIFLYKKSIIIKNRISNIDKKLIELESNNKETNGLFNERIDKLNEITNNLNYYINDEVDKLHSLLEVPNDFYIIACKSKTTGNTHPLYQKIVDGYKADLHMMDELLIEHIDFRADEQTVKTQSKYVNYYKNKKNILDIGCGNGVFLEMCREIGIGAIGVDLSRSAIDICNDKGLTVYHDDAVNFLLREDLMFDGIFCSHVLEHLDPQQLIKLLILSHSRLDVDGTLVVVLPNPESFKTQTIHFWRDLTHVRFYQKDLLVKLIESIGFDVVDVSYDQDTIEKRIFHSRWVI
jgi:O-antigen chain-terminating methyltransferase